MKPLHIAATAGALALALAAFGAVQPALAHDTLVGSDPADGSTVARMPETLTLTFNEDVMTVGDEIALTGPDGSSVATEEPSIDGTSVSVAVHDAAGAPEGSYRFAWRVVSADGHPIEGTIAFSVGAASASAPSGSDALGATPSSPAASVAGGTGDHAEAVSASEVGETESSASPLSTALWIGGAVLVVGAGVAVLVAARRRGNGPTGSE